MISEQSQQKLAKKAGIGLLGYFAGLIRSTGWVLTLLGAALIVYGLHVVYVAYTNAEDPADAVLEVGLQTSTWFMVGFGLLVSASGFLARKLASGIYGGIHSVSPNYERFKENADAARRASPVLRRNLLGNWEVVTQEPSQQELHAYHMHDISQVGDEGSIEIPEMTLVYSITEDEIVIFQENIMTIGDPARYGYTLQDDRLLLQSRSSGLLSGLFAKFAPDYLHFRCDGSQLELTTNPIAAYDDQQIHYRLELQQDSNFLS